MESLGRLISRVAREASWPPIAVLVFHEVAGKLFGHEPYVDPVMHFLGGMAAAFFFRHAAIIAEQLLGTLTPLASDLLAFGLTCAIALFWEFAEFFSDQYLGTRIQRTLGNTMRDLLLGTFAAVLYLVTSRLFMATTRAPKTSTLRD